MMRSIVFDADGNEVVRDEKQFEVYNYNKNCKVVQEIKVKNPNRWSDTNPYVYTLKARLNGRVKSSMTR